MEKRCTAILPGRIIANLGPTHGTRLLPLEPCLDTLITEYMTALEYNWRNVRIMTNWTNCSSSIEFILCRWPLRVL